jgi:TolB-like protein
MIRLVNKLKPLLCIIIFCNSILVAAQSTKKAYDTIFMSNGEKKEGTILSLKDKTVKFVYTGENLEYELEKADINKIVFASGRTEIINYFGNSEPDARPSQPSGRKGKIAVLPFELISNDPSLDGYLLSEQLQAETYLSIKKFTSGLELQDPITTNNLLAKYKLSYSSLKAINPKEMAELLAVEFVVYGTANIRNSGDSTYEDGFVSQDVVATKKKDGKRERMNAYGTEFSSNSITTVTNFETKIILHFFNDRGADIYAVSRNSMGSDADAYLATINYLIKRCPYGSKSKR